MDDNEELPPPYSAHDPHDAPPALATEPVPTFEQATAAPSPPIESSARAYSGALSLENLESGAAFTSASSREYFSLRPPKVSGAGRMVTQALAIQPAATPEHFKHPGKEFRERDVNEYDWMTFLNHCFLEETLSGLKDAAPAAPVIREKGRIVSPGGGAASAGSSAAPRRRQPKNADEDAVRRVKIITVVDEWNSGFFQPRGIRVRAEIARTANLLKQSERDIDARPAGGETPLYKAVRAGEVETTRLLLSKGADPNRYSMGWQPALYMACDKACDNPGWFWTSRGSSQHREILYLLLAYGADVDAKASSNGTAVYVAAKRREPKLVALLVKWGANCDRKPSGGESALAQAAARGDLDLARLLLDAGASPDEGPSHAASPLERAVQRGDRATFDLLVERGAAVEPGWAAHGSSPVLAAVERDQVEMLRALLSHGADPDRAPTGRDPPLLVAATRRRLDVVRTLLEWGADPGRQRWGRESPLAAAVGTGSLEIVREMLRERPGKADPERHQALVATARKAALEKGHLTKELLN